MQALMRGDRRIFGSFWRRETEHLFSNRQQMRYELLQKLQAVGAIRADLDAKTAAYILSFMSYGMWNVQDIIPPEQAPAVPPRTICGPAQQIKISLHRFWIF